MKRNTHKKTPEKRYTGYMKFPLIGANDVADFNRTCEYAGDFANPRKRYNIFKRERSYYVEIWVKLAGGGYEVSQVLTVSDKLNKIQLAELLCQFAIADINKLGAEAIQEQSFYKVMLARKGKTL